MSTISDLKHRLPYIARRAQYPEALDLYICAKAITEIYDEMQLQKVVTHGAWNTEWYDHKEKIVCSICGCFSEKMSPYCPNCGAYMGVVIDA